MTHVAPRIAIRGLSVSNMGGRTKTMNEFPLEPVDVEKVHQAVSGGAAGGWQLTNNGGRVLKGDMSPGFKIKDYLKDLGIIMETADAIKMPLPATSLVLQMYRHCQAEDMLDNGTQAVVKAVETLASKTVK